MLCCAMWLGYAFATKNPWLMQPNITGLAAALFCMQTTHALADRRVRARTCGSACVRSVAQCVMSVDDEKQMMMMMMMMMTMVMTTTMMI